MLLLLNWLFAISVTPSSIFNVVMGLFEPNTFIPNCTASVVPLTPQLSIVTLQNSNAQPPIDSSSDSSGKVIVLILLQFLNACAPIVLSDAGKTTDTKLV